MVLYSWTTPSLRGSKVPGYPHVLWPEAFFARVESSACGMLGMTP